MAQNYTKVGWQDHVKDETTGVVLRQGTPVSASKLNQMDNGIDLAHQKLEGANRQTQNISHGIQVINGDVNAPVSLQIEGRTHIPLQNTELDAAKFYVLADKKTKIKLSESLSVQGVNKFPGVNAKVQAITRIANFESKASGATQDNPHIAKRTAGGQSGSTSLLAPSSFVNELEAISYGSIAALGGSSQILSAENPGAMSQLEYGFNIIEEIERNLGKIPKNTLAEKVIWARENISRIACNWHGFGSGPTGNKVSLQRYTSGAWTNSTSSVHTNASTTRLQQGATDSPSVMALIQSDGFVHFIAYAEPASASVPSYISADYVELEIELKPTAELHAPRIPLFEVSKAEYDEILVNWNADEVQRRYPMAEGIQHIQNPYVLADSENLLAPFYEWNLGSTGGTTYVTATAPYTLEIFPLVAMTVATDYDFLVKGGQQYTFSLGADSVEAGIRILKGDFNNNYVPSGKYSNPITFTTDSNETRIRVRVFNAPGTANTKTIISNPTLVLGNTVKSFTPKNTSYMFLSERLGAFGGIKDLAYQQEGKMFIRKAMDAINIDNTLSFTTGADYEGFKTVRVTIPNSIGGETVLVSKHNGKILKSIPYTNFVQGDEQKRTAATEIGISVADIESGFGESYAPPTPDEWKAFFNGWKAKTVDANGKPTAWISIVDGTDSPTQTLAYASANKATGYTPYKVLYALANPTVSEAKQEGALTINGITQIEVGSGVIVREKVNAMYPASDTLSYINATFGSQNTWLKYPTLSILAIYKGQTLDKGWIIGGTLANTRGRVYAAKKTADIDPTADYYVTYVVFDRSQLTTNAITASATFANNIRTALDDNIKATEDNRRDISINAQLIYDIIKRLKAGGL